MTAEKTFPFDASYGDWLQKQQDYWRSWFDFCNAATKDATTPQLPWARGLEEWWKAVASAGIAGDSEKFLGRIIEQGRTFLGLSEAFSTFFKSLENSDKSTWLDALQSRIREYKDGLNGNAGESAKEAFGAGFLPFFELPLDTWNRTLSGGSLFPGDFLRGLRSPSYSETSEPIRKHIEQFLAIPGVGYTREMQDSMQHAAGLFMNYERAYGDYVSAHSRIALDALELLQAKLSANDESAARTIESLRDLYNLWVDCSEDAYSRFVSTEDYANVYSALVNSLMRLKQHSQRMVDEAAGAMNLPTQQGVTSIQCRQQELRREVSRLRFALERIETERRDQTKKRTTDPGVAGPNVSASELTALRSQVKELQAVVGELTARRSENSRSDTTKKTQAPAPVGKAKPARRSRGD